MRLSDLESQSAAPLLGYRDAATTERYHQQGQSLEAQRAFAKAVQMIRNAGNED